LAQCKELEYSAGRPKRARGDAGRLAAAQCEAAAGERAAHGGSLDHVIFASRPASGGAILDVAHLGLAAQAQTAEAQPAEALAA
jgi:hypothetical protein